MQMTKIVKTQMISTLRETEKLPTVEFVWVSVEVSLFTVEVLPGTVEVHHVMFGFLYYK